MIKFYHLLKKNLRDQRDQKEGIEILALRDAQIWLRNLTYRKLIRLCKTFMLRLSNDSLVHTDLANVMANVKRRLERKGENPSDCPYADPYYWAAFTITGVPPLL
jgi:CHAT domain-containing protein